MAAIPTPWMRRFGDGPVARRLRWPWRALLIASLGAALAAPWVKARLGTRDGIELAMDEAEALAKKAISGDRAASNELIDDALHADAGYGLVTGAAVARWADQAPALFLRALDARRPDEQRRVLDLLIFTFKDSGMAAAHDRFEAAVARAPESSIAALWRQVSGSRRAR